MRAVLLALATIGCGGPALQTVKLHNGTPRAIEELYIYPLGAANHGVSRGKLDAGASTTIQVPSGNVEVLAISALIVIDTHTRDKRTASSAIELKGPTEVLFFDDSDHPVIGPKVIPITFKGPPEPPKPPRGEGEEDPDAAKH